MDDALKRLQIIHEQYIFEHLQVVRVPALSPWLLSAAALLLSGLVQAFCFSPVKIINKIYFD